VSDDQPGTDWVNAVLAEYGAHRAEVVAAAGTQQQTLAFGATAVGLVVAGAFNVWSNRLLASAAFLGAVPLLCVFVLVQWVGYAAGLIRVGLYLEHLEDALRTAYPAAPPQVFVWEKTLAAATRRGNWWKASYEWHDFGAIAMFTLLAYGSIALGAYRAYARHEAAVTAVVLLEILMLSGIAGRFLYDVAKSRRRVRESFEADREADA